MIFDTVCELLSDIFDADPEEFTMDTDLEFDLNADSLDALELAMALEEEFELTGLTEEDFSEYATVRDIVLRIQELTE